MLWSRGGSRTEPRTEGGVGQAYLARDTASTDDSEGSDDRGEEMVILFGRKKAIEPREFVLERQWRYSPDKRRYSVCGVLK